MASIGPKDALEDMIVSQMLVCYDLSMECYAYSPNSKNCSREDQLYSRMRYLLLGSKLSHAFTALVDALNYRRGKGQQHILVEHVHVHSGGQAVVGNIRNTAGGLRRSTGDCTQKPKCKDAAGTPSLPALRSKVQKSRRGALHGSCNGERPLPSARWQDTPHTEGQ